LNWYWLLRVSRPFDDAFLMEHEKYLDWAQISRYTNLSLAFIEKYQDKLSWRPIIKNYKLYTNVKNGIKFKNGMRFTF